MNKQRINAEASLFTEITNTTRKWKVHKLINIIIYIIFLKPQSTTIVTLKYNHLQPVTHRCMIVNNTDFWRCKLIQPHHIIKTEQIMERLELTRSIKWKSYKSENLFYILTCIKYANVFMCAVGISRHVKSIPSVFLSCNSKHLQKNIQYSETPI